MRPISDVVRRRGVRSSAWLLALLAALVLVWMVAKLGAASDQLDAQRAQLGSQAQVEQAQGRVITAIASDDSQLRAQVESLGGTPKGPAPQVAISGITGATGAQGPGPSDAQVQSAVDIYLEAHPPAPVVSTDALTTVVTAYLVQHPPAPGPPPSDAQVATAVAAYMAAHPAPSGPPGSPGQNGQDGKQGNPGVNGAPGSPPAGWTFEFNGVTYECVPDDGTPAPHYTCPPEPTASTSASASSMVTPTATPTGATPSPTPSAPAAPLKTAPSPLPTMTNGTPRPTQGRWVDLLLGVPFYRRGL